MKRVEIKELRKKLREYIRRAKAGQTILVTDRGEVVAEINPAKQVTVPPGLADLARRGLGTLGSRNRSAYRRPRGLLSWEEVAAMLDEVRGDR
jgi:prevent-host-death family protein